MFLLFMFHVFMFHAPHPRLLKKRMHLPHRRHRLHIPCIAMQQHPTNQFNRQPHPPKLRMHNHPRNRPDVLIRKLNSLPIRQPPQPKMTLPPPHARHRPRKHPHPNCARSTVLSPQFSFLPTAHRPLPTFPIPRHDNPRPSRRPPPTIMKSLQLQIIPPAPRFNPQLPRQKIPPPHTRPLSQLEIPFTPPHAPKRGGDQEKNPSTDYTDFTD